MTGTDNRAALDKAQAELVDLFMRFDEAVKAQDLAKLMALQTEAEAARARFYALWPKA